MVQDNKKFYIGDRVFEKNGDKKRIGTVEKVEMDDKHFPYFIRFDDKGIKWCDGHTLALYKD